MADVASSLPQPMSHDKGCVGGVWDEIVAEQQYDLDAVANAREGRAKPVDLKSTTAE